MTSANPTDRSKLPAESVGTLAWPVGLLLLEATALTPFVEFSQGSMAWLANPFILTGGIVSVAAFMVIVMALNQSEPSDRAAEPLDSTGAISYARMLLSPWSHLRYGWFAAHGLLYLVFFWWSISLHARAERVGVGTLRAALWLLLGVAVAVSIFRAFLPLKSLLAIASRHAWQVGVALAVGVAMVALTPVARDYWTSVNGPGLELLTILLNVYPGDALVDLSRNRWPIIGTQRVSLLVTPACSELDSLLAFALLSGTYWAASAERLSAWKYVLGLALGLVGMYLLLVARLYFLVLIGEWTSNPFVAVKFAHSRLSTFALLLYTLGALCLVGNLAARATPAEPSPEEQPSEELAAIEAG